MRATGSPRLVGAPASRLRDRPLLLCLLTLTVLTISRFHAHIAPLRAARPLVLLVVFAVVYAVLNTHRLRLEHLRSWPAKTVAGIAIMACLSVVFGISVGRAGRYFMEDYWKTLLLAFLLFVSITTARDLYRLVSAYVIGAGLLVYLALFVFGLSKTVSVYGYDANDVAVVVLAAFPLCLIPLQLSRGWVRVACVLVLIGTVQTVAASQSRGAFVGLVATGLALLLLVRTVPLTKRLLLLGTVTAVIGLTAPPGYWKAMNTLTSPEEDYNWTSNTGRKALFQRGVMYMLDYPLFGLGINNFPHAEGTISPHAKAYVPGTPIFWTAAHNSYVQVGSEMGIPGILLWLFLLGGGVFRVARLHRRLPRAWARGSPDQRIVYFTSQYLPASFVGFGVSSFFVSFAYRDPVYVLAAIAVGLEVSASALGRSGHGNAHGGRRAFGRRGTLWKPHAGAVLSPWRVDKQYLGGTNR